MEVLKMMYIVASAGIDRGYIVGLMHLACA